MEEQVSLRHVRARVDRFKAMVLRVLAAGVLVTLAGLMAQAQIRNATGVPARSGPLNIPPSVTSIENHMGPYLPNVPASVTSISPYNFNTRPYTNAPVYGYPRGGRFNHCRNGGCAYGGNAGYGYGYSYSLPYYVYPYDPGYDSEGGGGPYLYSSPPQGGAPPAEQTLHIIVDSAPQRTVPRDEVADAQPERPAPAIPDAKPGEPTTLVFRDGHTQEVTNYAIMGQTVYVFDTKTKKIALADLDVPATVKANDDQGVEFQVPKAKQSAKPATPGVPLQSAPDQSPKTGSSTTATP